MAKLIDLTGERFGKLKVIKRAENSPSGQAKWLCICDCGCETIVYANNIRRGLVTSCGCVRSKKSSDRAKKHGLHGTNLYNRWKSMKERCADTGNPNYGGRGISVCDEWKNDFMAFYTWSMLNGFKPGLEIDRIDCNGNYDPENCRWVTRKVNSDNRRCVKRVKAVSENETKIFSSASEAARKCGVSEQTVLRSLRGVRTKERRFSFYYAQDID